MGLRFLLDLADVVRAADLPIIEEQNWEFRSRSTGGYDRTLPTHVMWHHTASGSSSDGQRDVSYMCYVSLARPIANLYIDRQGVVWVLAGGATNTNGKGADTWGGGVPLNSMNKYAIGIEIANNGIGESYTANQHATIRKLGPALSVAYGIPPERHRAHFEWSPTRKIDPAGPPSPWANPNNRNMWDMNLFRSDIANALLGGTNPPVEPPPTIDFDPKNGQYGLYPLNPNKATIREGSKGDIVKYLQGVIYNKAGGDIAVDGDFGPQTDKRVKDLQAYFKIVVDGIVGPQTWGIIDMMATSVPETTPTPDPTPPPTPPPASDIVNMEVGIYWVRSGDSPWSAAERIYGSGTHYAKLQPTEPASPGFNAANHHIRTPGVNGKATKVKAGEGPYSVLKRMGYPGSKLESYYDFNGGPYRILHPGDLVFVPA